MILNKGFLFLEAMTSMYPLDKLFFKLCLKYLHLLYKFNSIFIVDRNHNLTVSH